MQYLVVCSGGPGFDSPEEGAHVLREVIMPTFTRFLELEKAGIIKAGGLPVGERAFVFIVEADGSDTLDALLRGLPNWPIMTWEVTPLVSFASREVIERGYLASIG